ncbi:sigma-70 family RNA polymerase sigma factor [Marinihelvus fidelis]|uniref:Sigma-70 family RNA polymerase sigma factor n=1 Tax=Marinihelvus fidelis TaxID=2613842 RepID=A0A5N0TJ58_9GAMM|nr:sigma-70 family RNA polymerase sigma factor [Marinihelvus fidelis]KAA9133329.1 sigma-70 family RNA polymerase sigma factor [Marinihelvus fidelis]
MNRDGDEALIRDCRKGDRQALGSLVRRYERPVYNAAYRMLGNADEAADVAQTTFLKAFEHLDRYNPKYRFFSWIYRIAVNESIDRLNGRSRLRELDEPPASNDPGPDDIEGQRQLSRQLQSSLMGLTEDQRAVIMLRHFVEISYREIGEILQIPEKTVKSRLFTARQRLKDMLEVEGVHP